jgi:hypothetical protein
MGLLKSVFKPVVNLGKAVIKGVGAVVSVGVQAVSIVASAIIGKPKVPDMGNQGIDDPNSLGNRVQISPATNNKLPVVYGNAFLGGIITDLSISTNNQNLYYCVALSEVTNNEFGNTPDTFSFGKTYWGGKLCNFDATDQTKVISLTDESTGAVDTSVNGYLFIYKYRNGSNAPVNTSLTAIQVMSDASLSYKWDSNNLMSGAVFAIVKLIYNATAGITGIQQTKFEITNSRNNPADCLMDYMKSVRYGAEIKSNQIATATFDVLRAYSNENFTFTPYTGGTATIKRFQFDGVIETTKSIQSNMQIMADCCDCLIRYNEITAQWGVITQKPTVTPVMNINDSNMISAISITPIETASTYNLLEVYYVDNPTQDSFNSVLIDLAIINPSLLYENEPVNKQNITLSLVNNNVRAQYLATRFLEGSREDLQVSVSVMFVGLQLEAGDIVTVTNEKYGWDEKIFRIGQVR